MSGSHLHSAWLSATDQAQSVFAADDYSEKNLWGGRFSNSDGRLWPKRFSRHERYPDPEQRGKDQYL